MPIALIDADSIYFRAAMSNQKKKDIRQIIDRTMKEIQGQCFAEDNFKVAVKGYDNFRKKLYPQYKANRPPIQEHHKKALAYGWQYMIDKYDAVQANGMEADDLVSIWAYECREMEQQYVIVGIDKDLLQIPGNHYNFKKVEHQFIDDDTAHHLLMVQCLTGDNSDNIPGIKGVGPVKAKKALEGVPMERRWSRVRAAWRAHNAGDPELSYKLLRMLTSWEEYEDITSQVSSETTERKQDVREEGTDDVQTEGVSGVSGEHPTGTDGDTMGVREG